MAVTFGFYNSKNGDRTYNAEQMSSIFSGIIKDGVFADHPEDGMQLKVTAGTGLKVVVGPGRAWFNDTWTNNDSPLELDIPAPPTLDHMERIDSVVLEVNKTNNVDSTPGMLPTSVAGRSNAFVVVTGTPSADPQPPTLRDGDGIHQHLIAYIRTRWDHPDSAYWITNMVGVTNGSPIIIGAVQSVSAENVLAQWHNEVDNLVSAQLAEYLNDDGSLLYSKIEDATEQIHQEVEDLDAELRDVIDDSIDNVKPVEILFLYIPSNDRLSTNTTYPEIEDAIDRNRLAQFRLTVPSAAQGSGRVGNRAYYCYNFYRDVWISPQDQIGRYTYHINFISDDHSEIIRVNVDLDNQNNTVITHEIIYLKPLTVMFAYNNGAPTCDKTFAELSAAILAGRPLDVFVDKGNRRYSKATYSYALNSTGTAVSSIDIDYQDIWPEGLVLDDWSWECIFFTYTASQLTASVTSQ